MSEIKAWDLTIQVDKAGSAEVWRGNLEQAELYHVQLVKKGLTMAPIERT
jgi:ATP-dependent Clp protease adaptor protein ClpS